MNVSHSIPEAPTFKPTVEEWKEPLKYIASIRKKAEAIGIAKIVPPQGWEPPFNVDKRSRFPTKKQSIHQLLSRDTSAAVKQWWDDFNAFQQAESGTKLKKKPMAGGQEVDLYVLYRLVKKKGGYYAVSEEKGWKDIVAAMQIPDKNGTAASTVKQHYYKLLEPYEIHCKSRNEGGASLLAAALDKGPLDDTPDPMDVLGEDGIDDDEAAEILEAMLGLAPAIEQMDPPKKKRKSTTKDSTGVKVPDNIFTMVCESCKGGHLEDKIILCDRCDKGWHMFCLAPPLESVPEGDWVCPSCIASEAEMAAFRVAEPYSFDDFERFGNTFEKQWFGNQEAAKQAPDSTRESEYWRIVEKGDDIVEVLCGMDIDSSRIGSGFPTSPSLSRVDPADPSSSSSSSYVNHPWNLNNIPSTTTTTHEDDTTDPAAATAAEEYTNLLAYATNTDSTTTIPNINSTTINIGMLFSSFPWHVQEHLLYSLEYSHYGASKKWYAVPSFAAAPFEVIYQSVTAEASSKTSPNPTTNTITGDGNNGDDDDKSDMAMQGVDTGDDNDDNNKQLLGTDNTTTTATNTTTSSSSSLTNIPFRLSSMIPPYKVQQRGVPIYALTQEPGTFIITFPNAYHCAISLGINFTECINVAMPDWLQYGSQAASKYYCYQQPTVVCQQKMIINIAQQATGKTITTSDDNNNNDDNNNDTNATAAAGKKHNTISASTCYWVHKELQRIIEEERVMRAKAWSEGLFRSRQIHQNIGMDPEDTHDATCAICKQQLYLSAIECDCCPHRRVCLHHAENLCECSMRKRRLAWRCTLQELDSLEQGVAGMYTSAVVKKIQKEESTVKDIEQKSIDKLMQVLQGDDAVDASVQSQKEDEQQQATKAKGSKSRSRSGALSSSSIKKESQDTTTTTNNNNKTEEGDDLEALAGFMASNNNKKRKRDGTTTNGDGDDGNADVDDDQSNHPSKKAHTTNGTTTTDALPLTLVVSNGYVEGPVQPFKILDVYPEDREAASEWLASLAKEGTLWADRAHKALDIGGPLAEELSDLVEQAEQFTWGGAGVDVSKTVETLQPRLADAEDYMSAVQAALKGKPTLEMIDLLLKQEPKPLANPPGIDALKEAVAAAAEWQERAAKLCDPGEGPIEMKALETAVNEASRLPVSLPGARLLRDQLNMARNIANAIRNAIPTAREAGRRKKEDGAITIEQLQVLAEQAKACRVEMPEVANLHSALENIEQWQERSKELMSSRAQLIELRALLDEGDALPVVLHETEMLRSTIEKAEHWLKQMHNLIRNRAPLKKMRDLLHSGYRLPVEIPEVDELRLDIRRREWEDSTRRVINTKGTLAGLVDAMTTAAEMGVEDSPLAIHLKAKLEVAQAWDDKASDFLARFHAPGGCAEIDRPTIEQVAELVNEGTLTGVKIDQLTYLTQQLTAANKWLAKARQCLPPPPVAQEVAAEGDGNDGDDNNEGDAHGSGATTTTTTTKTTKATPTKSAPAYDILAALLTEYEDALIIKTNEANMLRTLRAAADRWLDEARPVLEQEFVVDEQLPLLNELIASGKATGVAMEQVEILEANVEALLWAQQVREILSKLPELPKPTTQVNTTTAIDGAGGDADSKIDVENGHNKDTTNTTSNNDADDTTTLPVTEEQVDGDADADTTTAQQPPQPSHTGLTIPPLDAEPSDDEADTRPIPTTPLDQRPSLPRLVHLVEEGSILPCDEELFVKFKAYVDAGLEWDKQARSILMVSNGVPAATIDVRKLRKLIVQGERLALDIPALPRLYEVLRSHEKWEQRVRDLMSTAGSRPDFSELRVFQDTARMNPVTSNLRRHIDAAVESVEEWKEKVRRAVAKRNTGMRLDRCFDVLGHSVDCAVEQFERKLELEKKLVSGPRNPGAEQQEDEWELYCLCQQPYNVDTSMISCDICGEWYHIRCVGLTQGQARNIHKYACPICSAVRSNFDALEAALVKLRKTQRPSREELGDLLNELKQMPVAIDEEAMLEKLLTKYDRWTTATYRAIEVHHLSQRKDNNGQVLPLSDGMLHQLCKSALALEIDATQYADSIFHLLRCNRWRARVAAVLDAGAANNANAPATASTSMHAGNIPTGKASAEAVAKLLIEAERLEVDTKNDVAGARLLAAAEQAKQWKDAVRQCIADLKTAGGESNEEFQKLIERAKELTTAANALPIRVERELEKLFEYAKPYCLCRKAYDEQIPMVECDNCGEWYHFECVGLPTPGSNEEDTIPERFSCPTCCIKATVQYPYQHKLPEGSITALKEISQKMAAKAAAAAAAHQQLQKQQAEQAEQAVAAAAAAQMAAAGMFPQGWAPFAAQLGRSMYAAPGAAAPGAPTLMPAAMMNPQALASMMEAYPHMVHPGMASYAAGLQQQQQAVAAAAAAAAAAKEKKEEQGEGKSAE